MRIRHTRSALALLAALGFACTDRSPVAPPVEPAFDIGTTALPPVRISEFHYDNTGTDAGEAIEISGPAGTNLTGYSIVLYNGSNTPASAVTYNTVNLSGTITASCALDNTRGFVVQNYPVDGIQN